MTGAGEGAESLPVTERAAGPGAAVELLAVLRRGWATILIVTLVVAGLATYRTLHSPELYEAEARLLVRIGREYVYRLETGTSITPRAPSLSEMVNSEIEILTSRELADAVVRSIGVDELYPELLEEEGDVERATVLAVPRFREAASIRPVLESSVIKVGFEHPEPAIAASAVNLMVDRFTDKHLEVFGEERPDALLRELSERREGLSEAEGRLAEFKVENRVFDLDEQRRLMLGRSMELEAELRTSELELAASRIAFPENGHAPEPVELPPHLASGMTEELLRQRNELRRDMWRLETEPLDQLVPEAHLRLLDLELEEIELLRDFSEDSRKVRSVRSELERVRRFLASAESGAASTAEADRAERATLVELMRDEVARLDGEIELLVREQRQREVTDALRHQRALELRCEDQRRELASLLEEIRAMDGHEQDLRRLERELASASAAFDESRERAHQARFSEELASEKQINVRVIERAVPPVEPAGLPRDLRLALGGFLGLLAGVGAALLLDLFRLR